MKMTREMIERREKSEFAVFRHLLERLIKFHKHLDDYYHGNKCLRDLYLIVVDISHIQEEFRDKIPRSSKKGASRVAK